MSHIEGQKGVSYLSVWLNECDSELVSKVVSLNLLLEIGLDNVLPAKMKEIYLALDDHIENKKNEGLSVLYQPKAFLTSESYPQYRCQGNDIAEMQRGSGLLLSRVMRLRDVFKYGLSHGNSEYLDDASDTPNGVQQFCRMVKEHKRTGRIFGSFSGYNNMIWFTKTLELDKQKKAVRALFKMPAHCIHVLDTGEISDALRIAFDRDGHILNKDPSIFKEHMKKWTIISHGHEYSIKNTNGDLSVYCASEIANRVRDGLGLESTFSRCLIEIQFSASFFLESDDPNVHIPTISDSDFGRYFKPAQESDGWGRTIDLEALVPILPEGVHIGCDGWPSEFEWEYLGKTGMTPEPSEDDWTAYYERNLREYRSQVM